MNGDARMPFEFRARSEPTTVECPTLVTMGDVSRAPPMGRIADFGTSRATISSSSFAAQKTPMYGFPAISSRRSNWGPSVLREGDDGGAVLELDRLDADPAGRMLAAALPQVLVQDIVDENSIRLQVLLHVLPDRLDRPRRSVRAGRRPSGAQGDDHDAFLFLLGHRFHTLRRYPRQFSARATSCFSICSVSSGCSNLMRAKRSLASGVRICSSKTEGSVPFIPHAFSLFRRHDRFFGWRVKRRFVRWMTQAGTRRFDLTALRRRSFFAYGLFFATVNASRS